MANKKHRSIRAYLVLTLMASILVLIMLLIGIFIYQAFSKEMVLKLDTKYKVDKSGKIVVNYGSEFTMPKCTAYYKASKVFSKSKKIKVKETGEVDTKTLGKYKLCYEVTRNKITKKIVLEVEVKDIEGPDIELVSDPEHYTNPNDKYQEEGYTAVDNYDGDVTDKVTSEEKNGNVIYKVTDSAGNETTVKRKINYKDQVEPVINLTTDSGTPVTIIKVGETYTEQGYTATDDCDGDLTSQVKVEGADSIDNKTEGMYDITYSVTDKSGNTGTAVRHIYVTAVTDGSAVDLGNKVIYLTFDDGPGKYTQQLLDVLDKYNVKATFFVTAHDTDYQYMIAEEYKRGHTVAIHSYTHDYAQIYSSDEAFQSDIQAMSDVCYAQTGVRPTIIRFPGGSSNAVSKKYNEGIMTRLTQEVGVWGYQYCDWNVSSGDAGGTTSTDQVVANVVAGVQENSRSSVVLQHDIKDFSVNAVEQIIQWGQANGYVFLPITDTTAMVHHGINN